MHVILITGKIGSGKSLLAKYLVESLMEAKIFSFAAELKDMVKVLYGVDKTGKTDSSYQKISYNRILNKSMKWCNSIIDIYKSPINRDELEIRLSSLAACAVTYHRQKALRDRKILARHILQKFGTDIGRYISKNRIWVNRLVKKIEEGGMEWSIIDDLRFEDELFGITSQPWATTTIYIERDSEYKLEHISETEIELLKKRANYILKNDCSADELQSRGLMVLANIEHLFEREEA